MIYVYMYTNSGTPLIHMALNIDGISSVVNRNTSMLRFKFQSFQSGQSLLFERETTNGFHSQLPVCTISDCTVVDKYISIKQNIIHFSSILNRAIIDRLTTYVYKISDDFPVQIC